MIVSSLRIWARSTPPVNSLMRYWLPIIPGERGAPEHRLVRRAEYPRSW